MNQRTHATAFRRIAWCLVLLATACQAASPAPSTPGPPANVPSATPAEIETAITRGIRFLVKRQNKDGSWGTARRTKNLNIFAPVPGAHHAFRAGTSALCVESLIVCDVDKDPAAKAALDRGEAWLLENLPNLRRADAVALYNVWGHAYGIEALAAMHRRASQDPERQRRIRTVIADQIDLLRRYESVDGGWGYYDFRAGTQRPAVDSTSFVTATVLVAFRQAKDVGVPIPEPVLERAIASLKRQQKNDHSYLYSENHRYRPMLPVNRPGGSLGRSQACNLALRLWNDATVTDAVFTEWLDRLLVRDGWLSIGRKRPVPHESWFQVAGYFYYYGHYYAALCTRQLPPETAIPYRAPLAAQLIPLQEKDGSWWDYPLYDYHQPYGTAFALMALAYDRP
ncbi:MAG TPA: terpene cyclase/mutase family protein [Verrucomicrobiota bacterium]|nr:terpene cyclase/mutase family protein [Verrucomicrobiota bacterium]HNU52633.1 terpene cyclase/mutase family protein [Verrucomicrobiota bacterium]